MEKIPERLKKIASYVRPGASVADIGTDHAMLPIYIAKNISVKKVIGTELNQGPYKFATKQVQKNGLSRLVDIRLGNGLQTIKQGEIDTVIIAGMGARTIIEILTDGAKTKATDDVRRLILQPMQAAYELRSWLVENSWTIEQEEIVYENQRYFVFMVCIPGESEKFSEILLEIGPILVSQKHYLLKDYLGSIIDYYQQQHDSFGNDLNSSAILKKQQVFDKIIALKEVLKEL